MYLKMTQVMNINSLYDKIKTAKMAPATAYKFSKLFKAIKQEASFYQEELSKILDTYGEKDENGQIKYVDPEAGSIQLRKDTLDEAQKSFSELFNLEVELPSLNFKLADFENLDLTLDEFELFTDLISEEKAE